LGGVSFPPARQPGCFFCSTGRICHLPHALDPQLSVISLGLLFVVYVESGNTPIAPDTVVTPGSLHPLYGLLVLAVYGLAGLVFGLFVWVGIPVLILSLVVRLSKLSEYR